MPTLLVNPPESHCMICDDLKWSTEEVVAKQISGPEDKESKENIEEWLKSGPLVSVGLGLVF